MYSGSGRLGGLTVRGRCLLAGGAATSVCAIVLDERDLLRIGIFVMLLPLLSLLLAARARRAVRAARSLSPERVPVGSDVEVTVTLRGGPLFGALRVADTVPDAAGSVPAAPPRFTVHRLPARGGVRIGYPLRPVLRGSHRIGPLLTRATDPLRLAEFSRESAGTDRLLVLPAVVALRGLPAALGTGAGTPGAAAAHHGHGSPDVLVRQYRSGDELRRVHWRSTARHDELMVRLEERPWRGGITVLLDRRDNAHRGRGPGSSLEFAVSLTASICAHLIRRGEPVTLVTEDGTAPTRPGATPGLDPMLDALAALRPSARPGLGGPPLAAGGDLVAVLGALGPGELEGLLARRPDGGHAVLLDAAGWDPAGRSAAPDPAPAAATLRRAGWQVAVATAGMAPDRVWDHLTSGAAPDSTRAGVS
ncbi:DUF58 domain-containing protein [Pseudonocardia sp. H11422]|uniref:DUF58 domain-containing protein n=1 Tax=Pseudonocardia sp. H11422 TaxID=2835866 RepID=UPI001BDC80D4|nr:DUF58 domain-containing protein [Pseudonocardia sp. H11422]